MKTNNPDHYFEQVYTVARSIPYGKVSTYGAIADYLALGSARLVGWALNKVTLVDQVPAHRVVNRLGELSGRHHFNPPSLMEELLLSEGVKVKDSKIETIKDYFWHPEELDPLEINHLRH
jgi:methylated-DNA-protein-cysteine methyltransferase related protein